MYSCAIRRPSIMPSDRLFVRSESSSKTCPPLRYPTVRPTWLIPGRCRSGCVKNFSPSAFSSAACCRTPLARNAAQSIPANSEHSVAGMMWGVSRPASRHFTPHNFASAASPVASTNVFARTYR